MPFFRSNGGFGESVEINPTSFGPFRYSSDLKYGSFQIAEGDKAWTVRLPFSAIERLSVELSQLMHEMRDAQDAATGSTEIRPLLPESIEITPTVDHDSVILSLIVASGQRFHPALPTKTS